MAVLSHGVTGTALVFAAALSMGAASAAGAPAQRIEDVETVAPEKQLTLTFDAPGTPAGETAYLFFQAYVRRAKPVGYYGRALSVSLNGQTIRGDRIANRPRRSRMRCRTEPSELIALDGALTLAYGNRANHNVDHPSYSLVGGTASDDFEFDVTGLLKPGRNALVFHNHVRAVARYNYPVSVKNVELRFRAKDADVAGLAPLVVPMTAKPPLLDGRLDEPCWKGAARLAGFSSINAIRVTQKTEAFLLVDAEHVYLGARCAEASMADLKAAIDESDGAVWTDDCIELFFDPTAGAKHYYQIVTNAIGTVADQFSVAGQYSDWTWSSGARVAAHRGPDAWTVEIAVPFGVLGGKPSGGDVWGFNLGRERHAATKEYSSWASLRGGFSQPRKFGRIRFGLGGNDQVEIVSLSRGWASPKGNLTKDNRLRLQVTNRGKDAQTLRVTAAGRSETVRLAAGKSRGVSLDYTVSDQIGSAVAFAVEDAKGTALYRSWTAVKPDRFPRVWQVENPLYDELLGDHPPGLQREGAIFWTHGSNAHRMTTMALRHGFGWSAREWGMRMKRHGLFPLVNSSTASDGTSIGQLMKESGAKGIILGHPGALLIRRLGKAGHGDMPMAAGYHDRPDKPDRRPFVMDPVCFDLFVADLEDALRKYPDRFWGVYFADEFQEWQARYGVQLFAASKKVPYPYIEQVDREAREKYGFGKFGMPTSLEDPNPYRWIAYLRWLNGRMNAMAGEFRRRIKAVDPELVLIGPDPLARIWPFDWSQLSKHFDVMTHQLYPRLNPNKMGFATATKLLVDLTGKPVWPCTHHEHYAASFTPAEARELISQVFRVGATGLHLYLGDTRGARAGMDMRTDYYGAPRRWRGLTDILAKTRTMNQVRLPEPDCAVLYSNDSAMAVAGPSIPFGDRRQFILYEAALSHLAKAGVWFRFVDDEMLLRGAGLGQYKAVFVPLAPYQRRAVVEKLRDYVSDGGAVVMLDPAAFRNDIDGTDLAELRESLLGRVGDGGARALGYQGAFERRVGKGRVIAFDFDPLADNLLADAAWQGFFRKMAADLKLQVDRKIWRFQFPRPAAEVLDPPPPGVCLTSNHVVWIENEPNFLHNAGTEGFYRYTRAPDGIPEVEGNDGWIAFKDGDLTDRRSAHMARTGGMGTRDSCVSWKTPGPVDIDCDLLTARRPKRAALWWKGVAPDVAVAGSADGKTWTPLGKVAGRKGKPEDVLAQTVALTADKGRAFRHLRISFACDTGSVLAEMEVWGSKGE